MMTSIARLSAARGGFGGRLRRAAGRLLLMCDARPVFASAIAIGRAFARRVEGFPCDPGGIVNPGFFGFGIAAGRLALLDDVAARLSQPRVHVVQFLGALDLDAEMVEAHLAAAR